jgi:predicted ATPase/DNA-binding winged helix-turn-helix (wHTH) protein
MQDKPLVNVAYVFGSFRLIPGQQLLLHDEHPVKLGGRALDILHLLVMRPGEEISKTTLIEFAWPGIYVDEHNLKVHISSLRRALKDTFPQASFIATVVGRGYQFVASVRVERARVRDFARIDKSVQCSLPVARDLIGRQRDVEGVARALDFARLVTLVGPGGVGKTSLAVSVAHARREVFPDGVHFADLSATDDPAFVAHIVATCLGIRGNPVDLISAIVAHLQDRRILIVLDNCEHLLPATATIAARLVEAKVNSCLLATSREPLGVITENVQRVEPLAYPKKEAARTIADALFYPSVRLFALLALETADYQLVDEDAQAVATLCEALDGLPLAIEIAVAKLDEFSPAELAASVGRRLGDLRNDDEKVHARHRTLWATMDWSYRLLSTEESTIFRLLAVFAGSFQSDHVANMALLVQYDPFQTSVALGGLIGKSLLSAEIHGDQICYRLLESAKSFAMEALSRDFNDRAAHRHHAQLVLATFEKSQVEWAWVESRVWRSRYEPRVADMRKALDWCFDVNGDASLGVDLAICAIPFWNEQSSISEQLFQVERALHHSAALTGNTLGMATLGQARAYCMTLSRQPRPDTNDAWNAAVGFADLSGDVFRRLSVMFGKAVFLIYSGNNEQCISLLKTFMAMAVEAGGRGMQHDGERLATLANMHLGKISAVRVELERLAQDLAQGLPPSSTRRYQEERYVSIHSTLAFSTWLTGEPERALVMTEEMVAKLGSIGQLMGQSNILALVALPLALWSRRFDLLERYLTILRCNLDLETIRMWTPVYRFYAAVARHIEGDVDAVEKMRSAINELIQDAILMRTPMYQGVLAEVLLDNRRTREADEAIELALTLQRQTKESWCLPELLRIKARILAASGQQKRAGAMLADARMEALGSGARSLELRILEDMTILAVTEPNAERSLERPVPIWNGVKIVRAPLDRRLPADLQAETTYSPV